MSQSKLSFAAIVCLLALTGAASTGPASALTDCGFSPEGCGKKHRIVDCGFSPGGCGKKPVVDPGYSKLDRAEKAKAAANTTPKVVSRSSFLKSARR